MSFRYLDSLDTLRGHWSAPYQHLAKSELIQWLLLGNIIRLSQTQAFDSYQVLEFADDTDFLELIREGYIEILPFLGNPGDEPKSPRQVFLEKVKDFRFHFTGWEIPTPPLIGADKQPDYNSNEAKERKGLLDEFERESFSSRQYELLYSRLDRIDRAYCECRSRNEKAGRENPYAIRSEFDLRMVLERCYQVSHKFPHLEEPLKWLLHATRGTARSEYHQVIRHSDIKSHIRLSLFSLVDLAYNKVIGNSVGSMTELTTREHDAQELLCESTPEEELVQRIEVSDSDSNKYTAVSWKNLRNCLTGLKRCSEKHRAERMLEYANDIGMEIAMDESKRNIGFRIATQLTSVGAKKGMTAATTMLISLMHPLAGPFLTIAQRIGEKVVSSSAKQAGNAMEHLLSNAITRSRSEEVLGLLKKGFEHIGESSE